MTIRSVYLGDAGSDREAPERSVGDAIRHIVARNPHAPAIVATGYSPCLYGELQQQIDDVGAALRAWGFDRDARIGLGLPEAPAAALAMLTIGSWAQAVPIDPNAPPMEIESQLAFLDVDAVLVPAEVAAPTRSAAMRLGLPVIETRIDNDRLRLHLAVSSPRTEAASAEPDLDSILYILQTSGTTQDPKHVSWSHRNQLSATERLQRSLELRPDDRALVIMPIHHSFGVNTLWTTILTGGSVAFPADPLKFDLDTWFDALKPTWYRAVPSQHLFILENLRSVSPSRIPRSLRIISTGSASLPDEIQQGMMEVLGLPVVESYGSSETGNISVNTPLPGQSKPGTLGRPDEGTVIIVGEDGHPVPPGEQGEILVGGPTVSPGYVNAPDLNRRAFVDGWYRTGDIGSLDEDGFLTLRGRIKDVINRGAEKVIPLEVEEALLLHPGVQEVAVFGVEHERLGEEVAAAVVLKPDTAANAADLRKFLGARLAWSKVPRQFIFVAELPRGAQGKVLRRVLKEAIGRPKT